MWVSEVAGTTVSDKWEYLIKPIGPMIIGPISLISLIGKREFSEFKEFKEFREFRDNPYTP